MIPTAKDLAPSPAPRGFWTAVVALTGLTWALLLCALWSPTYVPLFDLPNHMARHYLEYLMFSGGELPRYYLIEYGVLPNLGTDLIAPPLFAAFGPLAASKVLLTLCVFLYWLGPAVFVWQHGGFSPAAFAASLLLLPWVLSSQFFWGFINYYSGIGLAFLVLVQYCRLWREGRPWWYRWS